MENVDFLAIGSGPAGREAAIQVARLGRRAVLAERNAPMGGATIGGGAIPSKTLREAVMYLSGWRQRWFHGRGYQLKRDLSIEDLTERVQSTIQAEADAIRERLFRSGVEIVEGDASFTGSNGVRVKMANGDSVEYNAEKILIATGSRPARPEGIPFDDERIIDTDGLLGMKELPRSLTVVGANGVGLEYATIFNALDIKVAIVDSGERMLEHLDEEIVSNLQFHLRDRGIVLRLGEEIATVEKDGATVVTRLESGKELRSDVILFAADREGVIDGLGLDEAGVEIGEHGLVPVDEHFRTNVSHIYAAGDAIGFPSLASTSTEQGRLSALHAIDGEAPTFPQDFPIGIYAVPEISRIGWTEQELVDRGTAYEVGTARIRETARGQILGIEEGMLKMLFSLEDRRVLGVHILGEGATELIHIGQAALALGGTVDYFVGSVFNYPTLAEAYKVAALDALDRMPSPGARHVPTSEPDHGTPSTEELARAMSDEIPAPPSSAEMERPVSAEMERPASAEIERPVSAEMERPASAEIERPVSAEMERPASAEMERPVSAEMERPVSAEMERPVSAEMERPVSAEMERPVSAEMERPVSAEMERPASAEIERPVSAEIERPVSAEIERPVSAEIERPVSAEIERPVSAEMERPVSAEMERPASAEMERPVSAETERPVSAEMEKPVSAEMEQPAWSKIEKPRFSDYRRPDSGEMDTLETTSRSESDDVWAAPVRADSGVWATAGSGWPADLSDLVHEPSDENEAESEATDAPEQKGEPEATNAPEEEVQPEANSDLEETTHPAEVSDEWRVATEDTDSWAKKDSWDEKAWDPKKSDTWRESKLESKGFKQPSSSEWSSPQRKTPEIQFLQDEVVEASRRASSAEIPKPEPEPEEERSESRKIFGKWAKQTKAGSEEDDSTSKPSSGAFPWDDKDKKDGRDDAPPRDDSGDWGGPDDDDDDDDRPPSSEWSIEEASQG